MTGVATAYAWSKSERDGEIGTSLAGVALATATGTVRSSKATSCGARDNEAKQRAENAATKYRAGFQTRVAPERLTSRICETRKEVCCTRFTMACAMATPRRMKLFSASEIRHCA